MVMRKQFAKFLKLLFIITALLVTVVIKANTVSTKGIYLCKKADGGRPCRFFRKRSRSIENYKYVDKSHLTKNVASVIVPKGSSLHLSMKKNMQGTVWGFNGPHVASKDETKIWNLKSPLLNNVKSLRIERVPTKFKEVITYPHNSELGNIHSEGLQGLAHSRKYWFMTNVYYKGKASIKNPIYENGCIYKLPGNRLDHSIKKLKINGIANPYADLKKVWARGYHHLSDPDFYDGFLYVPITKGKYRVPKQDLCPIILLFDEDLKYHGRAYLRTSLKDKNGRPIFSGGAWTAINPKDKCLYVSRGSGNGSAPGSTYTLLDVYERIIRKNKAGEVVTFNLKYKHTVTLQFNMRWDQRTYTQGGDFSNQGLFFYVMDPKSKNKFHQASGVHTFKIVKEKVGPNKYRHVGKELYIMGKNNKKQKVNFIHRKYKRSSRNLIVKRVTTSSWELEGLDYVSPREPIYRNMMKKINWAKEDRLNPLGYLLVTHLDNEADEDDIKIYHYRLY
jgi:hypothetical protein